MEQIHEIHQFFIGEDTSPPMLEGIPVGKVSPWALVRSYVRRSFVRSFANFNFAKAGARPADGRLGGRGPSLGKIKICFLGGGVCENLQFWRKSKFWRKSRFWAKIWNFDKRFDSLDSRGGGGLKKVI